MPDPEAELERRLRVSSLSYARDQITALSSRVSAADRRTLDEHLTRVRELETRIASTSIGMVGAGCADPGLPDGVDPADVASDVPDQDARAALWIDLIEMAFACDMTRVITFGGSSVLTGAGMRHDRWADIGGVLRGRLRAHPRALEATTEGEGSVLDRTVALFAMEGGKGLTDDPRRSGDGGGDPNHSVDHYVMLVGGRAGGLRSGQHVSLAGRDLHPAAVGDARCRCGGEPRRRHRPRRRAPHGLTHTPRRARSRRSRGPPPSGPNHARGGVLPVTRRWPSSSTSDRPYHRSCSSSSPDRSTSLVWTTKVRPSR